MNDCPPITFAACAAISSVTLCPFIARRTVASAFWALRPRICVSAVAISERIFSRCSVGIFPTTVTAPAVFSTAAPTLRIGADGAPSFACATAGASIGYRPLGAQSWRGYVGGAIEVERGAAAAWATSPEGPTFEVFAHRLGYRPSEVVTLRVH